MTNRIHVPDECALQTTLVCLTILYLKFFATTWKQGGAKVRAGARAPEDSKLFKNTSQNFTPLNETEEQKRKLEAVDRWNRIVANDLESIPFALFAAVVTLFCCHNNKAHAVLTALYTISRVLYSIAFAYSLQPSRSIVWMVGVVSILGLLINGLVGVFA
eukprot:c3977_g1_i1.p1 GENE.c3977_g1_i1~~c3977_g1_i1.p1  ORF type:complete len:173 (+),score=38.22 c3977_g1_i1:42-521(+)